MESRGDSTGSLFVICNLIQKLEEPQPFKSYFLTLKWSYYPAVQLLQYYPALHISRWFASKRLSKDTIHQSLLIHTKAPCSNTWIHLQTHVWKNDHRLRPFCFQAFLCQCIS